MNQMDRNAVKEARNWPITLKKKDFLYAMRLLRCMEKNFRYSFIVHQPPCTQSFFRPFFCMT